MIRITGGKNRSRQLFTPTNGLTKPTMDKVRAAVFNALSEDVANKRVLDLFSGSGSYGFEALSRGALTVTFVDNQKEAIATIKKNTSLLKEDNVNILFEDAISFLKNKEKQYDIVFVDPPYKLEIYQEVLSLLDINEYLSEHAIVVLESDKELDINVDSFKKVKQYNYGLAKIYILRK